MKKNNISLTITMSVKDINQILALLGQDILTTEEEINLYDNLDFNTSEIPEVLDNIDMKVGLVALFLAAKGFNDEKKDNTETH